MRVPVRTELDVSAWVADIPRLGGVSPAVRDRIIREYIATPDGRDRLVASMEEPLRQRMAYGSTLGRFDAGVDCTPLLEEEILYECPLGPDRGLVHRLDRGVTTLAGNIRGMIDRAVLDTLMLHARRPVEAADFSGWRFQLWYMHARTFAGLLRRGECSTPGEREGREVLGSGPVYWRDAEVVCTGVMDPGVVLGLDPPPGPCSWETTLYNASDELVFRVRAEVVVGLDIAPGARIGRGEVEL